MGAIALQEPAGGRPTAPLGSVYRRLAPFMRPHVGRLTGAIIANLCAAAINSFSMVLLIPFLNMLFDQPPIAMKGGFVGKLLQTTVGHFIDASDKRGSLRNVILIMVVAVLLKNFFVWISGQLGATLQEYVTRDLRNVVYRHLSRLPLGYFTKTKAGQILSRLINDTFEARLILTQLVTQSMQAAATVVATIVVLVTLSWRLTVVALVVVPILVGVMQPLLRKLRKGNRRRGNQHGEMTSVLQETISGIRLVKSFAAEPYEDERFFKASNTYARTTVRLTRLSLLASPTTEVLGTLVAMLVLWIGAQQVLPATAGGQIISAPTMSGAMLITFLIAVLQLLTPLKQLTAFPATAQSSLASAERLFDILDTPAEYEQDRGTTVAESFDRELVIDNLSFAYETSETPVLRNVSLRARRGDVIALVGSSGAGKTTLVDLIPRFYEQTSGTITLDGIDTRTIMLTSLRSLIGIVSQDTVLFHDTVRNNIAYGAASKYTDAQIEAAARAANAHAFITALPDGYNTVLGERGTRLSGGQRQRISIARALLSDPPILILDEATSALDTESERLVQEAIDTLLEGRTVFVIAHRLSTVQHATQIIVLDHGEVVERGTHAELLAANGAYSRLHALQFRSPGDVPPSPESPVFSSSVTTIA